MKRTISLSPNSVLRDVRHSINRWNVLYPLDKWFRDKYKIRYNSQEHREIDIVDIRVVYEEDSMYKKAISELVNNREKRYIPGKGEWLNKQPPPKELNKEEIEDLYENLDLKQFDGEIPDEITIDG